MPVGQSNAAEVERLRQLVARRFGWSFDESRLDVLDDVLQTRARAAGRSPDGYLAALEAPEPGLARAAQPELRELAAALTVGETYFFRNPDHFAALAGSVLPDRIRARERVRRLRLLSAGCASGEEAYSLAMLLTDRFPELASWTIEIRAIDVNPRVIEKALAGRYSPWSLRQLPDDIRDRHFRAVGKDFVLAEGIRRAVSFEEKNLSEPDPGFFHPGAFDVIFCRNVIMYFLPEVAAQIVDRLARALDPDGFLFLGHAENLRGLSPAFQLRQSHETFYYQHKPAAGISPTAWAPEVSTPATASLPAALDADWVDLIRSASDRIAALARVARPAVVPAAAPAVGARPADLAPVQELLRQERFVDGLAALQDLPAARALDPDAQLLRAVLLTGSGQVGEARPILRRLLADDDLNVGAHYLMALCHEHERDHQSAFEHDRAAAYLDPSFAMPHLHLGLMARRSGDLETARAELGRALLLLRREEASRVLLFGGGFDREALVGLCRAELRASGGTP